MEEGRFITWITDSSLIESLSEFSATLIAVADIYNPAGNRIISGVMRIQKLNDRVFALRRLR